MTLLSDHPGQAAEPGPLDVVRVDVKDLGFVMVQPDGRVLD